MKLVKPDLNEERLNVMQAKASQVWRGEAVPKAYLAEFVLVLVAEVRNQRMLAAQPKSLTEDLFKPFGGGQGPMNDIKPAARQEKEQTFEKRIRSMIDKLLDQFRF